MLPVSFASQWKQKSFIDILFLQQRLTMIGCGTFECMSESMISPMPTMLRSNTSWDT